MFFIFNSQDNSYSWHGEEYPPEAMVSESQYLVEVEIDALNTIPSDEIRYTQFNKENTSIYVPQDVIYPSTARGKEMLEESLRSMLLVPEEERPSIFDLVHFTAVEFLGQDKVDAMFADGVLTDEETAQILKYIDGDTDIIEDPQP